MFKKRSRPTSVRDKRDVPDEPDVPATPEAEEDEGQTIEQLLLIRKLRRTQQGIDLERLNRGEDKKKRKNQSHLEPSLEQYGLQPGGLHASAGGKPLEPEEDETAIAARKVRSNNFTQQTNALDVDRHMLAYIDKEMKARSGEGETESKAEAPADPQAELFGLAERYEVKGRDLSEREEGNMTNSLGMLSAIPEVDLGMDNRLKNIEETEKARQLLLAERERKAKERAEEDPLAGTRFFRGHAPHTNIQAEMAKARREAQGLPVRAPRERPQKPEMATDDAVYERFKKR